MPESTLICIDASDYSRNLCNASITRLMGIVDFLNAFTRSNLQSNPENKIGFLTMSGQSCMVHESLTDDSDRILSSLGKISSGGEMHLLEGLKIARLALMSKGVTRGQRKILVFVCSPVDVDGEALDSLEILLRKEGVGLDCVNIGNPENDDKMRNFIEAINRRENCRYLSIGERDDMVDYLHQNYLHTQTQHSGAGQAEAMDADMELALRLSLEEENARRQAETMHASGQTVPAGSVENEELDEDLELAIKLSLECQNNSSSG